MFPTSWQMEMQEQIQKMNVERRARTKGNQGISKNKQPESSNQFNREINKMIKSTKKNPKKVALITCLTVAFAVALYWSLITANWSLVGLWLTPDQQGQRLLDRGKYAEAAESFIDPGRRGVALYRDGQFEAAAAAFGQEGTAEAAFNRGNALVLMGKYDNAILSYDKALQVQPEWAEAETNRRIAVARRDMLKPPDGDQGGIGGDMLGADEIVFDDRPKKTDGGRDEVVEDSGQVSDQELRAMWLRRVQTRPADFLRAKFAYQYGRKGQ